MKYAGIVGNDIADSITGICVSFWTQGCPHHCEGCQNPETWSFNGGSDLPENWKDLLFESLTVNGIKRDLSILGGEPLCPQNLDLTFEIINFVKKELPDTKINLWTGYTIEELLKRKDLKIEGILSQLYILVDGPYVQELRDTRLVMRGSSNQRLLYQEDIKEFLK